MDRQKLNEAQFRQKFFSFLFNNFSIGKNPCMDRLFVTNFEDKEALYKSARDKEVIKSDPPGGAQFEALKGEQPSSDDAK